MRNVGEKSWGGVISTWQMEKKSEGKARGGTRMWMFWCVGVHMPGDKAGVIRAPAALLQHTYSWQKMGVSVRQNSAFCVVVLSLHLPACSSFHPTFLSTFCSWSLMMHWELPGVNGRFPKTLGRGLKVFFALQISFTGSIKEGGRMLKIESLLSYNTIPLEIEFLWW